MTNVNITIVDESTGKILRTTSCPENNKPMQVHTGEFFVDGLYDPDQYIWSDSQQQMVTIPAPVKTLSEVKAEKSEEITQATESHIVSGFDSSALGAAHHYPAKRTDQLNLSGTIQRALLPTALPTDVYPFWCKDASDVWAFRAHTAAQIEQVGKDAYQAILDARVHNATLQAQIEAATTVAAVEAIVWSL